jgi:hypothetical protein
VSARITLAPFRVAASDSTPARGTSVTYTITSAEPLAANPTVRVTEPGRKAVTWKTTKVRSTVYKVTVKLSGKKAGTLVVRVTGCDTAGGTNTLKVSYQLN